MTTKINADDSPVDFGQYEGQPWAHVPSGYLRWMIRVLFNVHMAEAELARRGTEFDNITVLPRRRTRAPQTPTVRTADVVDLHMHRI